MNRIRWLLTAMGTVSFLMPALPVWAGSTDDLATAVNNAFAKGTISDSDVKTTLSDLIAKAKAASTTQQATDYRESIIDIVNAFAGSGITNDAASELINLAKP